MDSITLFGRTVRRGETATFRAPVTELVDGTVVTAVSFADGRLYFRYQNGVMMLIEATPEGYRERGSFEIPNVRHPSWSHPVIINGRLYLREQEHLYVYDLRDN